MVDGQCARPLVVAARTQSSSKVALMASHGGDTYPADSTLDTSLGSPGKTAGAFALCAALAEIKHVEPPPSEPSPVKRETSVDSEDALLDVQNHLRAKSAEVLLLQAKAELAVLQAEGYFEAKTRL